MRTIDLNCDLGEGFGRYTLCNEEDIIPLVSSINIACGWHGGDPLIMDKTIKIANKHNVSVGAHPGFFDLMGFGRRNIDVTEEEARLYTLYQLGAFSGICRSNNIKVQHLKPHGALYNMASIDARIARGICSALYSFDKNIILIAPFNSKLALEGKKIGLLVANEFFADRAYNLDGSLVSRRIEGSILTDTEVILSRIIRVIMEKKIETIKGIDIDIHCDSICVHGDTPNSLEILKVIQRELTKRDIKIKPLDLFIRR